MIWQVNKYNDCIYEDGKIICESPHFDDGKELFKKHSKLMAAAPDLLEALIEAKEVLTQLDHRHNGKCYNPTETNCNCTLCKIERAIQKVIA